MRLIAVNVAQPAPLVDDRTGRSVMSGIGKRPVVADVVLVGETNIMGDGQGDLVAHGGVDKAVYSYPHDHIPAWMAEIGYGEGKDAPFGENLSIFGMTEDGIHIGDRWQWGDAVLEIAQPRWPCFKLGIHSGHRDLPARLIASERSGWYSRVVQNGEAPVEGKLALIHRDADAPTVRETFRAAKGQLPVEAALQIAARPALANCWRETIQKRYAATEPVSG
ncbi:MAG TPA: MOSC domain-containing protein [Thermomicrobiales bacterium]|nr:MOSC domain-containing protein [Thermomicrobiales bacterium]